MNSIHDMGGMHGFGAIEYDHDDAPVFDAEWEKRIAGILACAAFNGLSVFDENRRAAEAMSAHDYLATPYFGRWLHMIETMVLEKGVATAHELRSGQCAADGRQWSAPGIRPEQVWPAFQGGGSARAEVAVPARYALGDEVRVKEMNPSGHTRLPRYARGKRGVVQILHGGFVFPDTRAHGRGDCPQHLYNVRFDARELWGAQAAAHDAVYLDLWDDYLE
jgi:nitrile hydratase beta subunit